MPSPKDNEVIRPGVIFCLQEKLEAEKGKTVNTIYPYFLVYIRSDGMVRYNFASSKKILEMLQFLCKDKNKPFDALCDLFDKETKGCTDMSVYNVLLSKAAEEIMKAFRKKETLRLTTSRDAVIVKKASAVRDFNLVTWFVIK